MDIYFLNIILSEYRYGFGVIRLFSFYGWAFSAGLLQVRASMGPPGNWTRPDSWPGGFLQQKCLKKCVFGLSVRKFRSRTSDNMDRWKSRGGKSTYIIIIYIYIFDNIIYIYMYYIYIYICCISVVHMLYHVIPSALLFQSISMGQRMNQRIFGQVNSYRGPSNLRLPGGPGFAKSCGIRSTILLFGCPKAIWQSTWEQASCSVSVVSGSSPCEHLPKWSQIPNQSLLRLKRTQDSGCGKAIWNLQINGFPRPRDPA